MKPSQEKQFSDPDVRHFIYARFAKTSRPPTSGEVADHFNGSIAAVEGAFERLADAHHIALAPGSHSIWMAHPFSGLPTNYVAEAADKKYWGNWVWDIFGISAILGTDARGHAPCGCGECDEKLDLMIRPGKPLDSGWIVHFVVSPKKFWDNIGYTWATILAFSSKEHLDAWLTHRNLRTGYMMPIQTCWELAQKWYTGRLDHDWQRPDQAKAQKLFDSLDLKGNFWNLS